MKFQLTNKNKKGMLFLASAGYKVTFGKTVYPDNTRTFTIWRNNKRAYGVSSTTLLNPSYAMRTIIEDATANGFKKGQASLQKKLKDLLNIENK